MQKKEFVIPSSVHEINANQFDQCTSLIKIELLSAVNTNSFNDAKCWKLKYSILSTFDGIMIVSNAKQFEIKE